METVSFVSDELFAIARDCPMSAATRTKLRALCPRIGELETFQMNRGPEIERLRHEKAVALAALKQRQNLYDRLREALQRASYYITAEMAATPKAHEIYEITRRALLEAAPPDSAKESL